MNVEELLVYAEIGVIPVRNDPEPSEPGPHRIEPCRGCMTAMPIMAFVPCGHLAFCARCFEMMNQVARDHVIFHQDVIDVEQYARPPTGCPVCRQPHTSAIGIFC